MASLETGARLDQTRLARAAEPRAEAELGRVLRLRGQAAALLPQDGAGGVLLLLGHLVAGNILWEDFLSTYGQFNVTVMSKKVKAMLHDYVLTDRKGEFTLSVESVCD